MNGDCQNQNELLCSELWKLLRKFPALRYMKPPVDEEYQLYERYPGGAERGVTVFVINEKAFYAWDFNEKQWIRLKCDCPQEDKETETKLQINPDLILLFEPGDRGRIQVEAGIGWNVQWMNAVNVNKWLFIALSGQDGNGSIAFEALLPHFGRHEKKADGNVTGGMLSRPFSVRQNAAPSMIEAGKITSGGKVENIISIRNEAGGTYVEGFTNMMQIRAAVQGLDSWLTPGATEFSTDDGKKWSVLEGAPEQWKDTPGDPGRYDRFRFRIGFTYTENREVKARSAEIQVGGANTGDDGIEKETTVTVNQEAGYPFVTLNPQEIVLNENGDVQSIQVTANIAWTVVWDA
jgi:hypothetical protein